MNRQALETHDDVAINLRPKGRLALRRYSLAVALASLALLVRWLLPLPEGTAIYQLPLVAVLLSGWLGGRGPGLFASIICVTGVWYWFIPPVNTFDVAAGYQLPFAMFIGLCLLLTEFSGRRRRTEHALRASEERFRTLVQFSFDVYWETDAQHRFTRREFSERFADAPALNSDIGKTRWEVPYLEPDEDAWRNHRAMLDAHLPFRDFELARPTPDGGKHYFSVSGMPVFDEGGRFVGYRGVGRHITERKLAEAEHRAHVWFLESMDRINRAMQASNDLERMMSDVLDAVFEVFACDRAWLLYPCDPDAPCWRVVMEHTRPEFPGAFALGRDLPMTADSAEVARAACESRGALPAGPGHERQVKPQIAERFGVQSEMMIALHPKGDKPYLFGLHQCSRPRSWTKEEQRLFEEIGHRLTDALSTLIAFRSLRESEQRLEAAQHIALVGWWERDYATGRVSLSDEACRIFGVQPVDLAQWRERWVSLIHPDDRQKTADASETALRGGPRYDVEYRIVRPDGTIRVVHSQGDVTWDESGRPVRQFGVMQDITELRRAEDELRASEARFRTFVDRATDAFFLLDEQLRVVDVNRQACESLGWSGEELIGMQPREFDVALDEASIERLAQRARAGEVITFETRHRRKDGTTFPVEIRTGMFRQAGKLFYLALARDITERKLAEESLRQSEAYLTEAQRLSHTGSWALDVATNRYVYTSEEFDRLFGFDPQAEAPTREAVLERMHPEDRISWKRILEKSVGEKLDTTSEYRIMLPDGGVRHIHTIRHPVVDSTGKVVKLVGTSIDITERKHAEEERERLRRLEAELAHANRVNTLGELTTSIAHEVSQPLGAMVASAGACARWLAADPPAMGEARAALDNIIADGKRARDVIGRIRTLTKRQPPRKERLDINREVLDVLALTDRELRSQGVVPRAELDSRLPPVAADRVQLQQVLLNLIVNAIDAMSAVKDRLREVTIVSRRDGSHAVLVEVRDSGIGLDSHDAERVFDAFYTTKTEGIGIGLSISRSILEAHGGRLSASANEPHGAVFRFSLPIAKDEQS